MNFPRRLLAQPVSRLLVFAFLVVALVPMGFLSYTFYRSAWKEAWHEVYDKHRVLATNLASAIHLYVTTHEAMLGVLADGIGEDLAEGRSAAHKTKLLNSAFQHLTGYRSLVLLSADGRVQNFASRDAVPAGWSAAGAYATESCFLRARDSARTALSNIKRSPITGRPTLLIAQPVVNTHGRVVAVLLGELRVDLLESLRTKIHFGAGGHSTIVDKKGHVIAHPNAAWMAEMRDLSSWPVVQAATSNQTGVMEFYSSHTHADMVAGFATVADIGWGVLVPQPKAELEERIHAVLWSYLRWGVAGLVLALLLAFLLTRWITRPIKQLAAASVDLATGESDRGLPLPVNGAPREITQLARALADTLAGLRASRHEVVELNLSLQRRVENATEQLQSANAQLQILARYDHLTSIANRRHFEATLDSTLRRRARDADPTSLMLIDVDNFKEINDRYGHPAGDAVLVKLAAILQTAMRTDDLVARYGGDEFVALMRCAPDVAARRAEEIRAAIETQEFTWENKIMHTTVSVGLLSCKGAASRSIDGLLRAVDAALYDAKERGRNQVVAVSL